MLPVVLIELTAEDAASPHTPALISACNAGMRRARCVLATDDEEPSSPIALAVVTWGDSRRLEVLIEVGTRRDSGAVWRSRQVRFQPVDADEERWRSVGFAIASLAGDLVPTERRPESSTHRAASDVAPAATGDDEGSAGRDAQQRPVRVGAQVQTGPGLDRGSWRIGGAVTGAYDFSTLPLYVDASAGYALRPNAVAGIDMSWITLGIGFGVRFALPVEFEGRAGARVVLQQIRASEHDSAEQGEDTATRWLGGGALGAFLGWPRTSRASAVLGLEIVRLSGATGLESHGVRVGSNPATSIGFFAGVEVRL